MYAPKQAAPHGRYHQSFDSLDPSEETALRAYTLRVVDAPLPQAVRDTSTAYDPLVLLPATKRGSGGKGTASCAVNLIPNESTPEEIARLIQAEFGPAEATGERIVGLVALDDGVVFPMSVVASQPELLANRLSRPLYSTGTIVRTLRGLCYAGEVTRQEVEALLVLRDDPFLQAAFELYAVEGDLEDLVDTLRRIVVIRSAAANNNYAAGSKGPSARPSPPPPPTKVEASGVNAVVERLLALEPVEEDFPSRQVGVSVRKLKDNGLLTGEESVVLEALAAKSHPVLQTTFEAFAESGDADELCARLRAVAQYFGVAQVAKKGRKAGAMLPQILEAFEKGDYRVCGAWDLYVDEHEESEFADSLEMCASLLAQELAAAEDDPSGPTRGARASDEKTVLRRLTLALHQNGRISTEMGTILMSIADGLSPLPEASKNAYAAARVFMASSREATDVEELVQSFLSLVPRVLEAIEAREEERGEDSAEEGEEDAVEVGDEEEVDPQVMARLTEELHNFVTDIGGQGEFTEEEQRVLHILVDNHDPRLMAAAESYLEEGASSLPDFLASWHALCKLVGRVEMEDEEEGEDEELDASLLGPILQSIGLEPRELADFVEAVSRHDAETEKLLAEFTRTNDLDAFARGVKDLVASWSKASSDVGSHEWMIRERIATKDELESLPPAQLSEALRAFAQTGDEESLRETIERLVSS